MDPTLACERPAKFTQAMNHDKSGNGGNAMMQNLAGQFSPDDVTRLAAYYAPLK